ncbi:MAG: DUF371 domain-containing protein [Candidatus Bathyarchaeota archaeon]|nr:DUF371 domain-containing protein [Candidatus Bathyarchaeota archaeon]
MNDKEVRETVLALGHRNITATHPLTLMFTKDTHLSKRGDCIVAVAADKAVADLSPKFKEALRAPNARLTIQIETGGLTEIITAKGSPKLILSHPTDMVIRRSDFISDRTLAIGADKASLGLPRPFIDKLKNSNQQIRITLIASSI